MLVCCTCGNYTIPKPHFASKCYNLHIFISGFHISLILSALIAGYWIHPALSTLLSNGYLSRIWNVAEITATQRIKLCIILFRDYSGFVLFGFSEIQSCGLDHTPMCSVLLVWVLHLVGPRSELSDREHDLHAARSSRSQNSSAL